MLDLVFWALKILMSFVSALKRSSLSLLMDALCWSFDIPAFEKQRIIMSNSISNHPGDDTLTSQILFIFTLFVNSVEMINPWKFQPPTPYSFKVIEIWKFVWNGCSGVKSVILIIIVFVLSSWNLVWVSLLGWEIKKSHKEDLKINQS